MPGSTPSRALSPPTAPPWSATQGPRGNPRREREVGGRPDRATGYDPRVLLLPWGEQRPLTNQTPPRDCRSHRPTPAPVCLCPTYLPQRILEVDVKKILIFLK